MSDLIIADGKSLYTGERRLRAGDVPREGEFTSDQIARFRKRGILVHKNAKQPVETQRAAGDSQKPKPQGSELTKDKPQGASGGNGKR